MRVQGVWGSLGRYLGGVFGGVLEVCLWYFGRLLGGKNPENIRGTNKKNKLSGKFPKTCRKTDLLMI